MLRRSTIQPMSMRIGSRCGRQQIHLPKRTSTTTTTTATTTSTPSPLSMHRSLVVGNSIRTTTRKTKFGTVLNVVAVFGFGMVAAGGGIIVTLAEQASDRSTPKQQKKDDDDEEEETSVWMRILGYFGSGKEDNIRQSGKDTPADNDEDPSAKKTTNRDDHGEKGPGKRVRVLLEPELIESLPIMTLEEVQRCNGLDDETNERLLVTYQGRVSSRQDSSSVPLEHSISDSSSFFHIRYCVRCDRICTRASGWTRFGTNGRGDGFGTLFCQLYGPR